MKDEQVVAYECCGIVSWLSAVEETEEEPNLNEYYEIGFAYQELSEIRRCKECDEWFKKRT